MPKLSNLHQCAFPLSNVVEYEHLFMQNSIFPMQLGCATSLLVCFFFVLSAISCLIFKTMLSTALVANQFNMHVSNTLINLSA